ncbi:SLC13 family permease [Paenibacillus sp. PL2-23]|uniref:SLC13 family permease n=1 Tax=Paenibacillus sp. PL2-23 TaxID=2100729 RepID=UPI0030F6127D
MKLTSIPMFRNMSNLELAKLAGLMEKRQLPSGETLFRQGDPGDSMFIVENGEIELYVGESSSASDETAQELEQVPGQQRIATIGAGDVLGEMALLTGEPRSAAAIAGSDCSLFVIHREVFDRLVDENPTFTAFFVRLLSQRLIAANDRLKKVQDGEDMRLAHELGQLPDRVLRFLAWCAAIPVATRGLALHQFGSELLDEVEQHAFMRLYIAIDEGSNQLCLQPAYAARMKEFAKREYSDAERGSWGLQAAAYYEAEGQWGLLCRLMSGLAYWQAALDAYEKGLAALSKPEWDELHEAVKDCPRQQIAGRFGVLREYLPYCEAHAPEEGLAVLELALHDGHAFAPQELSALYERGMELCRRTGRTRQAMDYMQLAENAASARMESERSLSLARQKLLRARSQRLAQGAGLLALGGNGGFVKALAAAGALLCVVVSFLLEPQGDLTQPAIRFIGIALAAVLLWVSRVIPDYIVALGMILLWVLGGVAAPEAALSGYGSTSWLYMIGIMAVSAVITKSGITYRFALHALKRFPSHYRGQLWGIVAGGTLMGPLLPSSTAKVSIGVPMAQTLAESMGFAERSRGAAGLGLVAMMFFGFTAPFVMTGSYTNVMAYGLAAKDQPVSWLQWLLYALPAFLLFTAVMLGLLLWAFRGIQPPKPIKPEVLDEQLSLLGPLSREEKLVLWTVVSCIVGMMLEPLHGIAPVWIMLAGFSVLTVSGALDRERLGSGMDWTFLLFLGAAFSFAGVAEQLGIAEWLSGYVGGPLVALLDSPMLFLLAVALISFGVTLIVRDDPAVILLVTAIVPLGEAAGIHPWVLVFIILLATDPFFFAYQSPTYLTAYYSTEGKAFTHKQGSRTALGYGLAVLLIAALCVPYWQWLGLIA